MLAAVCGHATGESPAQLVLTTRLPPCAAEGMAAGERCVAQSGSPELCCSAVASCPGCSDAGLPLGTETPILTLHRTGARGGPSLLSCHFHETPLGGPECWHRFLRGILVGREGKRESDLVWAAVLPLVLLLCLPQRRLFLGKKSLLFP